jgi:sec-independent protein translocase protein TatB
MGPEFSDVDWRAYDPRQYDPRRIVREALASPDPDIPQTPVTVPAPVVHDPAVPTPWDNEAT